ncbi:hypothetical protein BBH88_13400 [Planococcus antarcticus DSM 14505]|uniref:Threonine dehydratase n=1 Tax=Planococcus antarcticus DSM 14505 TaxID=1185653 RepID=A0ABM6D7D3_9BACL|nr:hypothetical protein [Planococcus antarcticus]ANU11218.1 hypothetical protein BBH88_13400 [Planococcus antarcticus DSM 14505]
MSTEHHSHQHNLSCGHTKIKHEDHIDYVHNGHLHHEHEGHRDECRISVTDTNPDVCAPMNCGCRNDNDCGHELVPHGDHVDYLVNDRLHQVHDGHCDDHGPVELVPVK